MRGAALAFFLSAAVLGLTGMAWGIMMAASHDHTLSPAHAHLNLIGWVSMGLFGLYYTVVPAALARRIAGVAYPWLHFGISGAGVLAITPGIAIAVTGGTEGLAIIGSLLTFAGMAVFVIGVVLDARRASSS